MNSLRSRRTGGLIVAERVQLLHIRSLDAVWARPNDGLNDRAGIFLDLDGSESEFADRHVDVAGLVGLELDAPGFDFLDGARRIVGDRAGFGIGHEPSRPQHLAELAHFAHGLRRSDGDVEIGPAFLAFLDQIVETDVFGPGGLGGVGGRPALGKDEHAHDLAAPMRQRDGAADHLVGLFRVHAQT